MKRANTYIGSPVERVEDLRFLRGRGQYIDDIERVGQWHAAIVRSPVAHARIINIASTAANVGYVRHSAYCAAKAGLLGLTRCVALEGAAHNVSCNAVNPGWVATDSNYSACEQEIAIAGLDITVEDYRRRVAEDLPQKRFLDPDEVAALIGFLCRDEAFGITAEAITIAMGSHW